MSVLDQARIPTAACRRVLASFLLIGLGALLVAPLPAQTLHTRTYSPDDGLPDSQIWNIYQDRGGFLWFATSAGLSRFDGSSFVNLSVSDGLPDPLVRTITEDRAGRLWVGTNAGVATIDGGRIRRWNSAAIGSGTIWASAIDSEGHLWFGTEDHGVVEFDGNAFRGYTTADGLPSDFVYSVFSARDGAIWLGTRDRGAVRFVPSAQNSAERIRIYDTRDGLPSNTVRAIAEDRAGNIYLGTRGGGVARFDGHRIERIRAEGAGSDVYALLVNRAGELVIGTVDNGVTIVDPSDPRRGRSITEANGLHANNVYCLLVDREGDLCVGLNNGATEVITEKFAVFTKDSGLPDDTVQAVSVDRDGSVWFGTYAGLAHYDPRGAGTFTRFTVRDGLPSDAVWDVHRDRRGELWVATRAGLARLRPQGGFDVFTTKDGLAADYIYDIFEDHLGNLWLATLAGVSKMVLTPGGPRFSNWSRNDGLPGGQIYTIAEDRAGRLWIGTASHGVCFFDGHQFTTFTVADGLPGNSINSIYPSRDGTIWIGTGGGGLARFDPKGSAGRRFIATQSQPDFSANTIAAIAEDGNGLLWLGTSHGVYALDLSRLLRDGTHLAVVHRFDKLDGLSSNEVLTSNGISIAADGEIWFGTNHGATRYDPRFENEGHANPPVIVERVAAGPHRYAGDSGPIRISPQRTVRFDFHALSFHDQHEVRYRYQLAGFDPDWSAETALPFKEYTNLPPRSYEFLVKARNSSGDWSRVARVELSVLPPFWATWWFRLIAVLVFVAAIVAIHSARTASIKRRNRELEAVIAARTKELENYSRQLELHTRNLESANERIREADRSKSRFLATMSHELRTPLNAIIGFSDVLNDRLQTRVDPRERTFLSNISESAKHLLALINDLLDLAKIEAGRMDVVSEPIDVPLLTSQVQTLITGMAASNRIKVRANVPEGLPTIHADSGKIKQILFNFLSNAIKFSKPDSSVDVAVRLVAAADSALQVDSIEFSVTDRGIGIRPEDLPRIFEEFQQGEAGRLHASHRGTGLGLAIVRRMAEIQNGNVTCESKYGSGSTFRLLLPSNATAASGLAVEHGENAAAAIAARVVTRPPGPPRVTSG